jgi:hypothetical protein
VCLTCGRVSVTDSEESVEHCERAAEVVPVNQAHVVIACKVMIAKGGCESLCLHNCSVRALMVS